MLHFVNYYMPGQGFSKLVMALGNGKPHDGIALCNNIDTGYGVYLYSACKLSEFYGSGLVYAWERAFNNGPNYIIRFAYLILTLCIEVPLVYFSLRNRSNDKKRLLIVIITVNVITTILVGVLERLLCQGQW